MMNIVEEFDCAQVYLEMAKEKFLANQYCSSLVSLSKAFPHMRSLFEKIYKLDREASSAKLNAGDDT